MKPTTRNNNDRAVPVLGRRAFVSLAFGTTAALSCGCSHHEQEPAEDSETTQVGCLVDTTLCIGCRKCEQACNRSNDLPRPAQPFTDRAVFRERRRPTPGAFTVVNEYPGAPSADQRQKPNTYRKTQCMHCLDPACVSACIVGALSRTEQGAVVYNPSICIGCRYCMIACPFQVPAYEYDRALAPRVRKCEFCVDLRAGKGLNPACAASCPTEAILFGKRAALLVLARDRIGTRPDRYLDHVYGEHEVGGTSWLYLTGRPGTELGLLDLPSDAPPRLTEAIQHGIFRYGALPLAVYSALAGLMVYQHRRARKREAEGAGVSPATKGGEA